MSDTATTAEADLADNLPARVEQQGSYLPNPSEWRTITRMADVLASSQLVPAAYRRRPENVILATLAGRPFGWDPTMSMRSFHIIEGVPSLKPEILLALVRQAGHSVTGEATPDGATVTGVRRDTGDTVTATFTMVNAKAAGLAGKGNWQKYPADMCWARALSAVCRRLFSDVVLGVGYTPEELGAADNADVIEATHTPDVDPDRQRVAALKDRARALPDHLRDDFADWFDDNAITYRNPVHLASIQAKLNELEELGADVPGWLPADVVDAEIVEPPPPPTEPVQVKLPDGPLADDLEPMTHAQNKKMFRLLNEQDIVGDEDRHTYASGTLGRDIASFKELTRADARRLIDALEKVGADQ